MNTGLEVAVIGMSGRFPKAENLNEFWNKLVDGVESISHFTDEELFEFSDMQPDNFVKVKGVFPNIDCFDASFFNYTPGDAKMLDPQVRALHEEVYHALEDAGYSSENHNESIGVYLGATNNFSWEVQTISTALKAGQNYNSILQTNDKDHAATKIAYSLNLKGPSCSLNCACSTSLFAIDMGCRSILTGACTMAICGGSGLTLPHVNGYIYQKGMIYSPDGKCRTFDKDAMGTVEGNGAGIVVLKSFDRAIKDRDHIYAVIKGTATNNDGNRKIGYTAPSVEGQSEVIKRALKMSSISPQSVSYIETHGTGTKLGDPVEFEALKNAYNTDVNNSCGLGFLKPNIGHLDTAAGVASFIKVSLALDKKTIPGSINFNELNPEINITDTRFRIIDKTESWKHYKENEPLYAGVSAFGIGGTNVHMILEEAPKPVESSKDRKWNIFCASALTDTALDNIKHNFVEYLRDENNNEPSDLAWTMQFRQKNLPIRFATVFKDYKDLEKKLTPVIYEVKGDKKVTNKLVKPNIYFTFSGQGSQYLNMAKGLYETEKCFRFYMDDCFEILKQQGNNETKSIFFQLEEDAADKLHDTEYTQILLFIIEYSIASMLIKWGIKPTAMIGHSIGEISAACIAGVFSLEDGIKLVVARGNIMSSMKKGAMTSVRASIENINKLLKGTATIAVINSPTRCSVSGSEEDIELFEIECANNGIESKRLLTSHAFHSSIMEEALPKFRKVCDSITFLEPKIPYVSNITGRKITIEEATNPEYYCNHIISCVSFYQGVQSLLHNNNNNNNAVFVEIGPGKSLSTFIRETANEMERRTVTTINTMRHFKEEIDDEECIGVAMAKMWENGIYIDWKMYHDGEVRNKVVLPLYPFDKEKYPVEVDDFQKLIFNFDVNSTKEEKSEIAYIDSSVSEEIEFFQLKNEKILIPQLEYENLRRVCLVISDDVANVKKILRKLPKWRGIFVEFSNEYKFMGTLGAVIRRDNNFDLYQLINDLKEKNLLPDTIIIKLSSNDFLIKKLPSICHIMKEEIRGYLSDLVVVNNFTNRSTELMNLVRGLNTEISDFAISLINCNNDKSKIIKCLRSHLADTDVNETIISYDDNQFQAPVFTRLGGFQNYKESNKKLKRPVIITSAENENEAINSLIGNRDIEATIISYNLSKKVFSIKEIKNIYEHLKTEEKEYDYSLFNNVTDGHELVEMYCTQLCFDFINKYMGLKKGIIINRQKIIDTFHIQAPLHRYADYFIYMLEKAHILIKQENGNYEVDGLVFFPGEIQKLRSEIEKNYPLFTPQLDLVDICFKNYLKAFNGEIPAISVLYPSNNENLLLQKYDNSIQEKEDYLIKNVFASLFSKLARGNKKLRILEVGGGYGSIPRMIMPLLKNSNVDYYFTDIGATYLDLFRKYAIDENLDFINFGIFDITKDPKEQGISEKFDLILAYNVVHATRNIHESFKNMKKLLNNGALLCVLERTHVRGYIDLVWGLAEGWWHFDKQERTHSPLISINDWEKQLDDIGLKNIYSYPNLEQQKNMIDVGIIIGQLDEKAVKKNRLNNTRNDRNKISIIENDDSSLVINEILKEIENISDNETVFYWDNPGWDNIYFNSIDSKVSDNLLFSTRINNEIAKHCKNINIPHYAISIMNSDVNKQNGLGFWTLEHAKMDEQYKVGRIYIPKNLPVNDVNLIDLCMTAKQANINTIYINPQYMPHMQRNISKTSKMSENEYGAIEEFLIRIMSKSLGYNDIDIDENIFDLGADSFKLIQMTLDLEASGYKVVMNEIYNNPTIRSLAKHIYGQMNYIDNAISSSSDLAKVLHKMSGIQCTCKEICGNNILFIEELNKDKEEAFKGYLRTLKVSPELLPYYILDLTTEAKVNTKDDLDKHVNKDISYETFETITKNYFDSINSQQQKLRTQIMSQPIKERYELSIMQRRHFNGEIRLQLYLIQLDEYVERDILDKAFCDTIGSQGLMRSFLYKHIGKFRWKEFEAPQNVTIPYIDISGLNQEYKDILMKKIVKKEWEADFKKTDIPMFQVVLIKLNERRYDMLFQFDHSIFDVTSGQILRTQFLKRYKELQRGTQKAMVASRSYRDYLKQVFKGPNIDENQIIKDFNLVEYKKYYMEIKKKFAERPSYRIQQVRYSIDLEQFDLFKDEKTGPFKLVIYLFACLISRVLDVDKVAFDLLFQSRTFEGENYSDVMGMVLDHLPLLVPVDRENPEIMGEIINEKLRMVDKYNLNFTNLIYDLKSFLKYKKTANALGVDDGKLYSPCLLNYAGKVEREYDLIWDYSLDQLDDENQEKLDYADCYCIAKIMDNKLTFLFMAKFEKNMDVIKNILEDEVKILLERQAKTQDMIS